MRKHLLLAGTAAFAVALAAPAHAFDKVNWTWDSDVDVKIKGDWDIDNNLDPKGLVKVQDFQFQIGNVTADTTGRNVTNIRDGSRAEGEISFRFEGEVFDNGSQPGEGGGDPASYNESASGDLAGIVEGEMATGTVFGTFDSKSSATGIDGGVVNAQNIDADSVTVIGGTSTDFNDGNPGGGESNGETGEAGGIIFDVTLDASTIEESLLMADFTLDARSQLPSVDYQATAIGNNEAISSNVSTSVHTGQFAWGGFEDGTEVDSEVTDTFGSLYGDAGDGTNTGNLGVATSLSMVVAGLTGELTQGTVRASSDVRDMTNVQVLADATAVVNNKSIELDTTSNQDQVMMADVSQFSYMNSRATTDVRDVTVDNYSNLGRIGPVVQGAATAIGNNLSVSVSGPNTPSVE